MNGLSLRRWVAVQDGEDSGSVFACSVECAKFAAMMNGHTLGECQGKEGVDAQTVCDGGCENDW